MSRTVQGTLQVPGSKSITHRAMLLAAQCAAQTVRLEGALDAADTDATRHAMTAMGARFDRQDTHWHVTGTTLAAPEGTLDCANSGTTLRLLLGTAARVAAPVRLDGDASLRRRPNGPLIDALRHLGTRVEGGSAPLLVHGPLRRGAVVLPARTSSQYASSLLLSLPLLPGPSTLRLQPPLASAGYLRLTEGVAGAFGIAWEREGDTFRIPGGQAPRACHFTIEGDWSAAAFPLVAAAITGGRLRLTGLRPDSAQPDRRILDLLRSFGCRVDPRDDAVEVEGGPLASPGAIDVSQHPDLFPALAVLAAHARGTTSLTGGTSLRRKESDRITAMAEGLGRMGIRTQQRPDSLEVTGGTTRPATVASHGDHRIHMAFSVAALLAPGSTVLDPACVAVSYPGFHADLQAITESP